MSRLRRPKWMRTEIRKARRRTRFQYVEEAIPLWERPCGCVGSEHYLPTGIMVYLHSSLPGARNENDAAECRMCHATFRLAEVLSKAVRG